MKKLFLILLIILAGCATPTTSFKVKQLKTNEFFGAGYEHLDGKLFSIFCGGNGYANYDFVKDSCMHDTAKFAHNKGYEYFTMLSIDGDTNTIHSGYVSNGVFIPTEIIKHSQYYTIILIDENEKENVKNFYKVSDYYVPSIDKDENEHRSFLNN